MKQEFKWTINIELDVDGGKVCTDDPDRLYEEAAYTFERARGRFFDTLNSNDNIRSLRVLNEELK